MRILPLLICTAVVVVMTSTNTAYSKTTDEQEPQLNPSEAAKEALEGIEAYEELMEDVGNRNDGKVKGSCNSIATHSTCRDYTGSYWDFERIKLNCKGAGIASKDACPYSEIGGCRSGEGTILDSTAWMYEHGGQPITRESQPYMIGSCNMTRNSRWVFPADMAD